MGVLGDEINCECVQNPSFETVTIHFCYALRLLRLGACIRVPSVDSIDGTH